MTLPFGIEAELDLKVRWQRGESVCGFLSRRYGIDARIVKRRKHIHLIGICGTAMASLAGMLQLQGHRITGSDKAAYPPMCDLLRRLGIPIA